MATVKVENGYKYYGSKSKPTVVINKLNMTVEPGTIYGLLGASGCGKTTLLSCIVGLRQLNGGKVRVFDQNPESIGIATRIGYMPQEIALVAQMTIKESIFYFGRLYGMSHDKIEEKFQILIKLLELPPSTNQICDCSGGQQRRVSFACVLVHDPELLILDEPTVGLDPMLRERIWEYLNAITKNSKTAVIVTTHYIEETRQASRVGLMRNGILLIEDTPDNVMLGHGVDCLEKAFLILSEKQSAGIQMANNEITSENDKLSTQLIDPWQTTTGGQHGIAIETCDGKEANILVSNRSIMKALLIKNFIKMGRNPTMIGFLLLLPFVLLGVFYAAIGTTIKGNLLGIVNLESSCDNIDMTKVKAENDTCYLNNISCRFISTIASTDFIKPILYNDLDNALRDAKNAEIIGYIHIPSNFSKALQARLEDGRFADDQAAEQSIMETHLDMGAGQTVFYTELKIIEHYKDFYRDIVKDCEYPKHMSSLSLSFQKPIYGSEDTEIQQYMLPGIVFTMAFFFNAMVTATVFIDERIEGVWDRTIIAGASASHLLWSQLFPQFLLTTLQNIGVIVFISLAFKNINPASVSGLVVLLFLLSICGIFYGLVLSVYCKKHTDANYVGTGTYYLMVLTSGFMWPVECMPKVMRFIVGFSPFVRTTNSARNMIEKGWSFTHTGVYGGYITIFAWIILFYLMCLVGLRKRL